MMKGDRGMKITYLVSFVLIAFYCSGCVTTQVRGYTDTKYSSYKIKSVALLAISDDVGLSEAIENALVEKFESKGIKAIRSTDIIPPTRSYSMDEIQEALTSRGLKSIMIVDVGGSAESSQIVGYQSYGYAYGTASGSAYNVGNTTYVNASGSTSSNTSSYAIRKFKRDTVTFSKVYDVSSTEVVWAAQTETKAGGALFMSDGSTGGNLSETLINDLIDKGHI
jgi:hypothetical protein